MKYPSLGIVTLILTCNFLLNGQSLEHPSHSLAAGGGKAQDGGHILRTSFGYPLSGPPSSSSEFTLASGFLHRIETVSDVSITFLQSFHKGWNLISVPLIVDDYAVSSLYPSANSPAFSTAGGLHPISVLENGVGYWLRFPEAVVVPIDGIPFTTDTIQVRARWNTIGTISAPLPTTQIAGIPPVTITSSFYGYSRSEGFFTEATLEPGRGYWVRVSSKGSLVLGTGESAESAAVGQDPYGQAGVRARLRISDATGRGQTLQFIAGGDEEESEKTPSLPPIPSGGFFTARFASDRIVEALPPRIGESRIYRVQISSAEYPVTIAWEISETVEQRMSMTVGENSSMPLRGHGTAEISDPTITSVVVAIGPTAEIPTHFALKQNYPNPFNPRTTIEFDLPTSAIVTLKIFNLLGQTVQTLLSNTEYPAGNHAVPVDASHLSSGVYFYRITIQTKISSYTDIRKMVLME